ncbi:hypothetical protein L484_022088 [Morus notabilis]|uniref:Uncharacterized protein n=1 Tax=Morus notabilis TaxID=981085 RepID=W9RPM1_9ROSA|nr:hypothetical protein L484_022088 [Morus notabilis]
MTTKKYWSVQGLPQVLATEPYYYGENLERNSEPVRLMVMDSKSSDIEFISRGGACKTTGFVHSD